jgi:hypothetical protein
VRTSETDPALFYLTNIPTSDTIVKQIIGGEDYFLILEDEIIFLTTRAAMNIITGAVSGCSAAW